MSGRSPPLYCTLTLIAMQGHPKYTILVPLHHKAVKVKSLEHKEGYDILTDEEWYNLVELNNTALRLLPGE